jgi:hypothetical protein
MTSLGSKVEETEITRAKATLISRKTKHIRQSCQECLTLALCLRIPLRHHVVAELLLVKDLA